MRRCIKISVFTFVCFCCIIDNKSYACDTLPIPVIEPDSNYPDGYTMYMGIEETMDFDSNSYDPDNGCPHGSNHGIVSCEWWLYNYDTEEYYMVSDQKSFYFDPFDLDLPPGCYAIDLVVTDDEYNEVNGYDYYDEWDYAIFYFEGVCTPYTDGHFQWNIPWYYHDPTLDYYAWICDMNQETSVYDGVNDPTGYQAGDATIQKDGEGENDEHWYNHYDPNQLLF